jgi:hypothetical protein
MVVPRAIARCQSASEVEEVEIVIATSRFKRAPYSLEDLVLVRRLAERRPYKRRSRSLFETER